ncbi:MAG: FixH family protein [Burkholderiales bacterium]|nr:FixH family protein [Burkholderiales bacterium]
MQAVESLLVAPKPADKWLKEPWMLLVIGGPLLVVIAAISTGIIAWQSQDKVVVNDYYRQGLHIDQDLAADAKARIYNMRASLQFLDAKRDILQLQLNGAAELPAKAQLTIASGANGLQATEAIYKVSMLKVRPGVYQANLPAALHGDQQHWHLKLNGEDWRLTGRWQHGQSQVVMQPQ